MRKVESHLGFNLMPHWPNQLNTFGVIETHQGAIIDFKSLPLKEFVLIGTGQQRSAANPDKRDFFSDYYIPRCEAWYDKPFEIHIVDCSTVENLWKLRYSKSPGNPGSGGSTVLTGGSGGAGWAKGEFGPNKAQLAMLNEFGIYKLGDFAFGDKCFRLIKASTDPAWVAQYTSK